MPLKTIKRAIFSSIKKSAEPARNASVSTPARPISILLTRKERWWSNLPVAWNAEPVRSPVSMALFNGSTLEVVSASNTDVDKKDVIKEPSPSPRAS